MLLKKQQQKQNIPRTWPFLITSLLPPSSKLPSSHWITTLAVSQVSMLFSFVLATLYSILYSVVRGFLLKCYVRAYQYSASNPPMAPHLLQSPCLGPTWCDWWTPTGFLSCYYSPCTLLQTHWSFCCSLNLQSILPLKGLFTCLSFCLECYSPR